ncbi:hypothetical protein D3C73_1347260 [compost metagenome]
MQTFVWVLVQAIMLKLPPMFISTTVLFYMLLLAELKTSQLVQDTFYLLKVLST